MKEQPPRSLLGIPIPTGSRNDILETILKDAFHRHPFALVMSLNPEIFIIAQKNAHFRRVVQTSKYLLVDGSGVAIAARIMGIRGVRRYAGVDFMSDVLKVARDRRLRVMLIGGRGNLAERIADCYSKEYPRLEIIGLTGIENILQPTAEEEERIFSIVADREPHIVFIAFGSPAQELWAYKNRARFGNTACAGVGGAFDFLAGETPRAPQWMRRAGLEWLFRLVRQPRRWKRQLKLVQFICMIIKARLGFTSKS